MLMKVDDVFNKLHKHFLEESIQLTLLNDESKAINITDNQTNKQMTIRLDLILENPDKDPKITITHYIDTINKWLKLIRSRTNYDPTKIYPVIRPISFPTRNENGEELLTFNHTAETKIYIGMDYETGYKLVTDKDISNWECNKEDIYKWSITNLKKKKHTFKKQTIQNNEFYFYHSNDGYDASRVLLTDLYEELVCNEQGKLILSIPHQEVLIIAVVHNNIGYQIMSEMTMKFYGEGRSPITALSFEYEGFASGLKPIFIYSHLENE